MDIKTIRGSDILPGILLRTSPPGSRWREVVAAEDVWNSNGVRYKRVTFDDGTQRDFLAGILYDGSGDVREYRAARDDGPVHPVDPR